MRTNSLVVLIAIAVLGASSTAMAKGGGSGGGKSGMGHGHFGHFNHFRNFPRNQAILGGWGWGWDWGPGYGGGTNVLVSQQYSPAFPAAAVTGSLPPCHWNNETFNVPSSAGGKRPVEVMSCVEFALHELRDARKTDCAPDSAEDVSRIDATKISTKNSCGAGAAPHFFAPRDFSLAINAAILPAPVGNESIEAPLGPSSGVLNYTLVMLGTCDISKL